VRRIHQLAGDTGAEIAEAALVLPIAFMFLLGIVWFGRAFNIYSTITQAAQQGAIAAARPSCATCGNTTSDTAVSNVIAGVMQASKLDLSQIQANPTLPSLASQCPSAPIPTCTVTSNNVAICRSVVLNPTGATDPPECGAVVTFQYPFQFYLPFTSLNMQRIVLTAQSQSRMEN
jgi:Flp pilus assembly protein TadG